MKHWKLLLCQLSSVVLITNMNCLAQVVASGLCPRNALERAIRGDAPQWVVMDAGWWGHQIIADWQRLWMDIEAERARRLSCLLRAMAKLEAVDRGGEDRCSRVGAVVRAALFVLDGMEAEAPRRGMLAEVWKEAVAVAGGRPTTLAFCDGRTAIMWPSLSLLPGCYQGPMAEDWKLGRACQANSYLLTYWEHWSNADIDYYLRLQDRAVAELDEDYDSLVRAITQVYGVGAAGEALGCVRGLANRLAVGAPWRDAAAWMERAETTLADKEAGLLRHVAAVGCALPWGEAEASSDAKAVRRWIGVAQYIWAGAQDGMGYWSSASWRRPVAFENVHIEVERVAEFWSQVARIYGEMERLSALVGGKGESGSSYAWQREVLEDLRSVCSGNWSSSGAELASLNRIRNVLTSKGNCVLPLSYGWSIGSVAMRRSACNAEIGRINGADCVVVCLWVEERAKREREWRRVRVGR